MTRQKDPALSYEEAIDKYYGGIQGLSIQALPFKCLKCETTWYPEEQEDGTPKYLGVLDLDGCFKHIRRVHNERIKNQNPLVNLPKVKNADAEGILISDIKKYCKPDQYSKFNNWFSGKTGGMTEDGKMFVFTDDWNKFLEKELHILHA